MKKTNSKLRNTANKEWNVTVGRQMVPNSRFAQIPVESKRFQRMTADIVSFTSRQTLPSIRGLSSTNMNSMNIPIGFTNILRSHDAKESQSPFALISATFGFEHHKGTDRAAELKVLKLLLRRESLVSLVASHAEKLLEDDAMRYSRQRLLCLTFSMIIIYESYYDNHI